MKRTHQIAYEPHLRRLSLLLIITSAHAQEKGNSPIEYGITAYGIFNLATNGADNDGKMFNDQDSDGYYAGWSERGAGAGIGFSAMWQGYIGLDVQMLYTTHELSGSFNDPLSGQLDFEYTLTQFEFADLAEASYPNRYVTPSISMGAVASKDFSEEGDLSMSGGEADVRVAQGFSKEHG